MGIYVRTFCTGGDTPRSRHVGLIFTLRPRCSFNRARPCACGQWWASFFESRTASTRLDRHFAKSEVPGQATHGERGYSPPGPASEACKTSCCDPRRHPEHKESAIVEAFLGRVSPESRAQRTAHTAHARFSEEDQSWLRWCPRSLRSFSCPRGNHRFAQPKPPSSGQPHWNTDSLPTICSCCFCERDAEASQLAPCPLFRGMFFCIRFARTHFSDDDGSERGGRRAGRSKVAFYVHGQFAEVVLSWRSCPSLIFRSSSEGVQSASCSKFSEDSPASAGLEYRTVKAKIRWRILIWPVSRPAPRKPEACS